MRKLYNFIFIDIDGCFNKQFSKDKDYLQSDRFGLCQELVDNLKTVLNTVDNCKIVISSSWRKFRTDGFVSESKNWRDVLCDMLQVPYDTISGRTFQTDFPVSVTSSVRLSGPAAIVSSHALYRHAGSSPE